MNKLTIQQGTPFSALPTLQIRDTSSIQRLGDKLAAAGMKRVIQQNPIITNPRGIRAMSEYTTFDDSHVRSFLERKAQTYAIENGFTKISRVSLNESTYDDTALTALMVNWQRECLVEFRWRETAVAAYDKVPPEHVLDSIIQHRRNFDYITIATFEVKIVREQYRNVSRQVPQDDPLVLGRFVDSKARFLIAQYGDDINVNELFGR